MFKRSPYISLLLFVLIVAAVALSGVQFLPGEWYLSLQKPFWTPPAWLFPPVWTVLYLMIAIAGWLIFSGSNRVLKVLWPLQLVLNGLWSWLFFGLHQMALGLLDIVAMFACIAVMVVISHKEARSVSRLLMPYLVWVGYASTLNLAIFMLNPA